jgi:hypothetical protein
VRATIFSLFGVLCIILPGCGPSDAVWITVDLQKGGKPYTVPEDQSVHVTFYMMEPKNPVVGKDLAGEPFAANRRGEASYEVPGPSGWGIPAGKYRISVTCTPRKGVPRAPAQAKGTARKRGQVFDRDQDYLKNQFGPTSSPIIRTVDKPGNLTIDLDRPSE